MTWQAVSGESLPISSEQRRREDTEDRKAWKREGRATNTVYFTALPGVDLGTVPICVDSGTSFGKNLIFQSFMLDANGFLFPRLKMLKESFFPPKCSMFPIKLYTSQKLGGWAIHKISEPINQSSHQWRIRSQMCKI